MWLTIRKRQSIEIDSQVVKDLLNIYAEENLDKRNLFQKAFADDSIELSDLKSESSKILLPWQFFLLDQKNLQKEIDNIEKQRLGKVSSKLVAKRRGSGERTSRRIIDRLIRLQNYICDTEKLSDNKFCGSLINKDDSSVVATILDYFEIDIQKFRSYKNKAGALEYLIKHIENKNINISQGVLANKMLPAWQVVENSVYKNTSGLVVKDNRLPFIFLPSEVNPEETDGRQIYTLTYLLLLIGLNEYDFFIEKDFKSKALSAKGKQAKIFRLTSEFLLPKADTAPLKGQDITKHMVDDLSAYYKITPTAVLVTLKIRKIISQKKYEDLLPKEYIPPKTKSNRHAPGIDTSVRKFCGKHSFDYVNGAFISGRITSVQAQYLLFGAVNKKGFAKYRQKLSI
jgi:hypothetical protein